GFPPLVQFIVGEEATGGPERLHDGVKVMGILDAEMFLYCLDASRPLAVTARWHHIPPFRCASRCLGPKQAHAPSVSKRIWHMAHDVKSTTGTVSHMLISQLWAIQEVVRLCSRYNAWHMAHQVRSQTLASR